MADETTTSFANLLYEMREALQKLYPTKFVLSAELARDSDEANFSGDSVRVPLILNTPQGAGGVSEGGTVNTPHALRTNEAHVRLSELVSPLSITSKLRKVSLSNSAAEALALRVTGARESLARILNEMMHGDGDALLASITGAGGSPGLTLPVGTGANWFNLYPGRIVDVRTRSTGADPGQGLMRRIASVDKAGGNVVFDTASFGGGSGAITFAATSGTYIEGTYGNAMQGLGQVTAITGTFEDIDKALVPEWRGVDGRAGDVTVQSLSIPMLDNALIELQPSGGDIWEFGVGDPRAVNKYKQGLYAQLRWAGDSGKLATGFEGPLYNGKPLIGDMAAKPSRVLLVDKQALKKYGVGNGPDYVEDTGSMFQRFSRTTSVEVWLQDLTQLGALKCNTTAFLDNLAIA